MGQASDIVRRWVELYNDGTPDTYGSDRFLQLYRPDVDWEEMPSPMFPAGRKGNVGTLREAVKQSQAILRNRHAELIELVEEGNIVAWRGVWSATVAEDAPEGFPIKAGSQIQAQVASFTEVVDGVIVRQREYISNPEVL